MQRLFFLMMVMLCIMVDGLTIYAQEFKEFFPPFYVNGKRMVNATAGGLRNGQFSNIDFNNDGIKDLFVFDKTQERPLTFLGVNSGEEFGFEYAPEYESIFPKMYFYALLYDFNKDGVEDLFALTTRSIGSVNVWRGSRDENGLHFKEMIFRNDGFNSIQVKGSSGIMFNLPYALGDIPAIVDVDNDGDTDILTFDTDSGSSLYYFKNYAQERGLGIDTFDMQVEDFCFGKFFESSFNQELFLSNDPNSCASRLNDEGDSGKPRHPGSTILALDMDCDNDKDLLIGDLANYGVTLAINGGTKDNAWITSQDIHFPSNDIPVSFPLFHGIFKVDINNDGINDLVITPSESDGGDNINHIWCYLNTGTECAPIYKLKTKSFLIETMISAGGRSETAVMDINGDGLQDIIIGSNGLKIGDNDKVDRMYYFRNTGTVTAPEFTLVDDNYLNMDAKSEFPGALSPSAGDIDGDGDMDLLIGDSNGQLYLFKNNSGSGNPVFFQNFEYPYNDIFIGSAASPELYDNDGDGLNDLFIGEQNNFFNYFVNQGTPGNEEFAENPTNNNFGDLFPPRNDSYLWFGSPSFFDVEGGKKFIIMGFNNGTLGLYERIKDNGDDKVIRIDSTFQDREFGLKATPEIIDIDNDGYYDLIVGNQSGGLKFFHTEFKVAVTSTKEVGGSEKLTFYPNPAQREVLVETISNGVIEVFDVYGKSVMVQKAIQGINKINSSNLVSGCYFINFKSGNQQQSGILIKM